ncbi:MAG: glycosyltransferase [Bacillota bacterium]
MLNENKTSLSLCMIVKDEEEYIGRCLSSISSYVDEIVILDTGCTDNTVAVARQFGAKVYKFDWQEDFSAARNYIKGFANGDWILVLDADEEMPVESAANLHGLIQKTNADAYALKIINLTSRQDDSQVQISPNIRLFKNTPQYYFEGIIHEQIRPSILRHNPSAKIVYSNLTIIHYGYIKNNPKQRSKNIRNISLLKKAVENEPNNCFHHYNLGVSYYVNKELTLSQKHYQMARELTQDGKCTPILYRNYSLCLWELYLYDEAITLLEEGINYYPDYSDLYYILGQIYFALGIYKYALELFNKCQTLKRDMPQYTITQGVNSYLPLEYLADIYFKNNCYIKAQEFQLKAIRKGLKGYDPLKKLIFLTKIAYQENSKKNEILEFILSGMTPYDRLRILFECGLFEIIAADLQERAVASLSYQEIIIAAKTLMYLGKWQQAFNLLEGTGSTEDEEFILIYCLVSCILNKDMHNEKKILFYKLFPSSGEGSKPHREFILKQIIISKIHDEKFINTLYSLLVYHRDKVKKLLVSILGDKESLEVFYNHLGEYALQLNNTAIVQECISEQLEMKIFSANVYFLIGKLYLLQGNTLEGVYFIFNAAQKEPNNSKYYLFLSVNLLNYIINLYIELLYKNPNLKLIKTKICKLAASREILLKEGDH